MEKIDEKTLNETRLIGETCNNIEKKIKNLIDIIEQQQSDNVEKFKFFDIKGTVLLYGIAGTGKTSLANNVMKYALDKYGLETYTIEPSEIITSGLGESVKNLADKLKEFDEKEEGILFIDEIDKFFINRAQQDELSELKRIVIEMISFIDKLSIDKKKILIGCTNIFDQIDAALKRRFTICADIAKPSENEKVEFCKICLEKVGLKPNEEYNYTEFVKRNGFETMDSIKDYFRNKIIMNEIDSIDNELCINGGLSCQCK